ncbi:hypothetical protein [Sandaracinus amylolyticus]|uniref:hypothetical protein n=1 Tax=Sandaracinus amylolyticus TaxID=927083 RepID=UPI001F48699C|nr:hypothetical protein [Sandaracinus amylolyticus]UJR80742.1 Tryptophan synthase alpha chain [Sandaracinus amylolyticus]
MKRSMFALALVAMMIAGCDAIVGAECADGLVRCGDRCATELECTAGMDAGGMDAAIDAGTDDAGDDLDAEIPIDGDAGRRVREAGSQDDDGAVGDGAVDDGSTGDASMGDGGGPVGCDLGEIECDGMCVDGRTDPSHCGGCDVVCDPGELCAEGVCTATCDPPLVRCGARCIDVSSDPDNCGGCGIVCASGICIDGECSDALAGHVVAIGHDYVTSRAGMRRLAGNAVFLARGSPARVVVFEGGSTAASRSGTDAAIQLVANGIGRTWDRIAVDDPEEVPLWLADADAFVIYAQTTSTDAELREWGASWSRALDSFVRRGRVVVMFETQSDTNAGTWQILDAAGLFACTGRIATTSPTIMVVEPSDAVALRVPLTYAYERETVRFETTQPTVVCSDGTGPVVVHRTIVPR